MKEALGHLPAGVEKVMLRSDTAGYQQELLRYCAKGEDERFGVIEFACGGAVMSSELRDAVADTPEEAWHDLRSGDDLSAGATCQQWAEVDYVPNWTAYSKRGPYYRFLVVREAYAQTAPCLAWRSSRKEHRGSSASARRAGTRCRQW